MTYDYSPQEADCLAALRMAEPLLSQAVSLVTRPPHVAATDSPLYGPFESVAKLAKQGMDILKNGPTDFSAIERPQ